MDNTTFQIKKLLLCLTVLSCSVMPILPMRQALTLSARRLARPGLITPNLTPMVTARPFMPISVARRFAAPTHAPRPAPLNQGSQHTGSGSKQNYHNNTGKSDRSSTKKPYSSWWSKWSQWFSRKSFGTAAATVVVATGTVAVTQDEVVITDAQFTVENITKHPEHKDELIKHAQKNIGSADWIDKNFEALQKLFDLYPASVQLKELSLVPQVLEKLIWTVWRMAAENYETFHQRKNTRIAVLKKLLNNHPGLDDAYIKLATETKDFPLNKFLNTCLWYNLPCTREYWLEYLNKGSMLYDKCTEYLNDNPDKLVSIPPEALRDIFSVHMEWVLTLQQRFIEHIKRNPHAVESETLMLMYEKMSPQDQKIVREKMANTEPIPDIVGHAITATNYIPHPDLFPKCTKDNHGTSQTEQHFCQNIAAVLKQMHTYAQELTPEARTALSSAYAKEKEEQAKDNYVFYHAQGWEWRFKSDVYKQFFNLFTDTPVGNDYQFLRFDKDQTIARKYYKRDVVFLNGSLFGNAGWDGSCTFKYFMKLPHWNLNDIESFPIQWISKQFNLTHYYDKYKTEFTALEKMHDELITGKGSRLLLVSVPKEKVNAWIYTCTNTADHNPIAARDENSTSSCFSRICDGPNHKTTEFNKCKQLTSSKDVLDTLRINPDALFNSDRIEYAMPTENDELLDPETGPRIYDFNAADPKKLQKYNDARDTLFAHIKQDMQKTNRIIAWDNYIKTHCSA